MRYAIGGAMGFESWTTPVVRKLLWANAIVFLARLLSHNVAFWDNLVLVPAAVFQNHTLWMLGTYMYVHFDLWHLLSNLLGLWIFGPDVERVFGGRRFFYYYTACGVGGAMMACLAYPNDAILGASGALYGVILAFAVLFPYRPVYIFGVAPIEARWLAVMYGVIDLVGGLQGGGGRAHLAHLGGLGMGILIHMYIGKIRIPIPGLTSSSRGNWNRRPSIFSKLVAAFRRPPAAKRKPDTKPRLTEAEIDAILDKIAKNGMNSLTKEERQRLRDASISLRK